MRAVETNKGTGKWLTYWMVYACFTTFESIGRPLKVLEFIPFFYTTKLAVLVSSKPGSRKNFLVMVHGSN